MSYFLLLLVCLTSLISSCTQVPPTYRIGLRYIPEKLDPFASQINYDHFVSLQLYYPLFSRTTGGPLESEFLDLTKSRSLSSQFDAFSLCLKPNLQFSDDSPITVFDLRRTIVQLHKKQEILPNLKSTNTIGSCLFVNIASPDIHYFDKLTGVASTILSEKSLFDRFPIGLGPYRIINANSDSITLIENPGRVRGTFKKIEFLRFPFVSPVEKNQFVDLNHAGQVDIPRTLTSPFKKIQRPFFKSYAVIINHPNKELRRQMQSCFDRKSFAKLLNLPLMETPGFLPIGVAGSKLEIEQTLIVNKDTNCHFPIEKPSITFFNYRLELYDKLKEFFSKNSKTLPLNVKVENISLARLIEKAFSSEAYAAVIGFDSSTSLASSYAEASTFFESFFRTERAERIISQPVPGLEQIIVSAIQASSLITKERLYLDGHKILLKSGYVIPLGQLEDDHYYPIGVKSIVWSDPISGFPRLDLMEVQL